MPGAYYQTAATQTVKPTKKHTIGKFKSSPTAIAVMDATAPLLKIA